MRNKKNTRTCIVCKLKYEKIKLYRFVKTDNKIIFDKNQTLNSRGLYICSNKCLDQAIERKVFRIKLNQEEKEKLVNFVNEHTMEVK